MREAPHRQDRADREAYRVFIPVRQDAGVSCWTASTPTDGRPSPMSVVTIWNLENLYTPGNQYAPDQVSLEHTTGPWKSKDFRVFFR
jgi:hypothetical protein